MEIEVRGKRRGRPKMEVRGREDCQEARDRLN